MSVGANITLASLGALSRRGGLDFAAGDGRSPLDYVRRLAIKTPATYTPVAALSGGNQQKVALSRWLATQPSVLILDEPTQGVDVGAKSEIHALMVELAGQGVAILMISSELPEILGMSDRVAVMRGGTIVGVLSRAEATQPRHPRAGARGWRTAMPSPEARESVGCPGSSRYKRELSAGLAFVAPARRRRDRGALVLHRRQPPRPRPEQRARCSSSPPG